MKYLSNTREPSSGSNPYSKLALVLIVIIAIAGVLLSFYQPVSWIELKSYAMLALEYVEQKPASGAVIFMLFYFSICVLPMPLISLFTILAGYLFGNLLGFLLVSFMSALGGSLLFMAVRYGFRSWLEAVFSRHALYGRLNTQCNRFSTALSLRLVPGMPFFIPAIVLGLGQLSFWKFYLSTQLGLSIILLAYVNAGSSLAQIQSPDDILTPSLIAALLLLALLPSVVSFVAKKANLLPDQQ